MAITSLSSSAFDTSTITGITFIGGGACTWSQDSTALRIELPSSLASSAGYAVKISFSGTIPALATPSGFSGYYKILARHSGKAVVVQSASTANSANIFQYTYGGSATNDEWRISSIGGGYYRVINRNSGKDMVVQNASTAAGANIFQYTYGGTATNDEWAITDLGTGYYRITNRNSGKVVDVQGASTADGANILQYTSNGGTNQQFQIVSVP